MAWIIDHSSEKKMVRQLRYRNQLLVNILKGIWSIDTSITWGVGVLDTFVALTLLETSVRWNPTSSRIEKVEHYISKEKTHKPES